IATGEPKKFGPWAKIAPHATQPWAWRCQHDATGEPATVEVHFAASIEHGAHLRRAIGANPRLVALGAERPIGTNPLLLHPSEEWQAPLQGQFQFGIAREDRESPPATWEVTPAALATIVAAIGRLNATAVSENVQVDLRELRLEQPGSLHLGRP